MVKHLIKKLRAKRKSLGFRLSVFIMVTTIILFAATLAVCVLVTRNVIREKAITAATGQMISAIEYVNLNLRSVEETARDYVISAKYYTNTKEGCYQLCKTILENDRDIYAATIMFRPGYFKDLPKGHRLFAPTAYRDKANRDKLIVNNIVERSDSDFLYDKIDDNYMKSIKMNDGVWEEPYFDIYSTNEFLESYSYPLRDDKGVTYAVLCTEIQLKWLEKRMIRFKPTPNSKIAVLTGKGHFLIHHIPEYVGAHNGAFLTNSVYDLSEKDSIDPDWMKSYKGMVSGQSGMADIDHTTYFKMNGYVDTIPPGFVVFSPIKEAGWSTSAVIPESDIVSQVNMVVGKMLICAIIGLIVMAIALFYMVRKMVEPYKTFAAVHADITTASRIQMGMLQKNFPKPDDLCGTGIYALMNPAKTVGGDLYDFIHEGDSLIFAIGDVSGKGIPAALFMSSATTLFRVFARNGESPSQILTHINDSLSQNNDLNMFITMFVCRMNLKTGRIDYCNGGHNAPVVIHDNKASFIMTHTNIPVGALEDMTFLEESLTIQRGDKFLLYTDGVTEAENAIGKLYSNDRLLRFLTGKKFASAKSLCNQLVADIRSHAAGAEQSDDITMLCVDF